MILCNDGTSVTKMGNFIQASDGMYTYTGTMMIGPNGFRSMNVKSMEEAISIVCGLHGGRKL